MDVLYSGPRRGARLTWRPDGTTVPWMRGRAKGTPAIWSMIGRRRASDVQKHPSAKTTAGKEEVRYGTKMGRKGRQERGGGAKAGSARDLRQARVRPLALGRVLVRRPRSGQPMGVGMGDAITLPPNLSTSLP